MQTKDKTVVATKIFTWLVLAAVAAFLVVAPQCVRWYVEVRGMSGEIRTILLICVYTAAVPAVTAMVHMLLLLHNISKGQAFSLASVRHIGAISWCCLIAAVVVGATSVEYLPFALVAGSLLFMFLITRVVCSVMRAAVAIKDENSLTI